MIYAWAEQSRPCPWQPSAWRNRLPEVSKNANRHWLCLIRPIPSIGPRSGNRWRSNHESKWIPADVDIRNVRPAGGHQGTRARSDEIPGISRSEEHTSELQSLMRITYPVFCLHKKQDTHIRYTL